MMNDKNKAEKERSSHTRTRTHTYMRCVGDQDDGFLGQISLNALVEDVPGHLSIHGTQGVIQQVNVSVAVHGSAQIHPLLLSTAAG